MEDHKLKILKITRLTHDVRSYRLEKPASLDLFRDKLLMLQLTNLGLLIKKDHSHLQH